MTDKLTLYNKALSEILGQRKLASLTEDTEARYKLDERWVDATRYCLGQGQWNFATRSVRLDYSPSLEPSFGYRYAFRQPDDFVMISAVSGDQYFHTPLLEYRDEGGWWYADLQTIYVSYVSDDPAYGGNPSIWPATFCRYVEAYLAYGLAYSLLKDKNEEVRVGNMMAKYSIDARSKDAQANPTKMLPQGSWVRSRYGRRGGIVGRGFY